MLPSPFIRTDYRFSVWRNPVAVMSCCTIGMKAAVPRGMPTDENAIAYFDAITFKRSFQPSRAELQAALLLEVVAQDEVGTLYRIL